MFNLISKCTYRIFIRMSEFFLLYFRMGVKVFTASCDKTAKMWDLNSNQAIQIAQVINNKIYSLQRCWARQGCDDSYSLLQERCSSTLPNQLDLNIPETLLHKITPILWALLTDVSQVLSRVFCICVVEGCTQGAVLFRPVIKGRLKLILSIPAPVCGLPCPRLHLVTCSFTSMYQLPVIPQGTALGETQWVKHPSVFIGALQPAWGWQAGSYVKTAKKSRNNEEERALNQRVRPGRGRASLTVRHFQEGVTYPEICSSVC